MWRCTCPHVVFYQRPRQPQLAFTERSNSCMKDWNPKTSFLFPDLKNIYFQIWKYISIFDKEKGTYFHIEKISIRIWRNPRQKDCSLSLILQTLFSSPELLDLVRVSSHLLLLLLHITKSSFIIKFICLFVNVKLWNYDIERVCSHFFLCILFATALCQSSVLSRWIFHMWTICCHF